MSALSHAGVGPGSQTTADASTLNSQRNRQKFAVLGFTEIGCTAIVFDCNGFALGGYPMTSHIGKRLISLTAIIAIIALTLGMLAGCGKKKTPPSPDGNNVATGAGGQTDALDMALRGSSEIPVSLKKLVAETKDWSPAFDPWWGKIAPNFTLTDIAGNVHSLNNYRGKNVVILFWWTYNPTCKMAAARLKELRSAVADDSLVVLSISNEPPAALKEAATTQGINFVVLSGGTDLAQPFSAVDTLPTTFFIDQKGRFKLAASGVVSANDARAIIDAK
jgi:peroxiredoxin